MRQPHEYQRFYNPKLGKHSYRHRLDLHQEGDGIFDSIKDIGSHLIKNTFGKVTKDVIKRTAESAIKTAAQSAIETGSKKAGEKVGHLIIQKLMDSNKNPPTHQKASHQEQVQGIINNIIQTNENSSSSNNRQFKSLIGSGLKYL